MPKLPEQDNLFFSKGVYKYDFALYSWFLFTVGIENITVGLLTQKAEVLYDDALTNSHEIEHFMSSLGFPTVLIENEAQNERTVSFKVQKI